MQIRSEILSKARISGSTVPKENGVTLVTAEHMDILNDKRSRKRANEMDFELTALPALLQTALDAKTPRTERSAAPYAQMRYPRLCSSLMRSSSRCWRAEAFGSVCCLSTRAMCGRIQLCTFVCTFNPGTDLPVLLIDTARFGKKRNTTAAPRTARSAGRCRQSSERTAISWYIASRAPYSLIK